MEGATTDTGNASSAANTTTQTSQPAAQPAPATDAKPQSNAAPDKSAHREAFDRLTRGEQPAAVSRELFGKDKKPAAKPATETSTNAKPAAAAGAADDSSASSDQAGDDTGPQGYPSGTSEKDASVLKRGQMDAETWAAIPPSNRVKILDNLRKSQAEADRAFQQRNRQQPAKAGSGTQSNPDAQDVETSGGLDDAGEQPAAEQLDGQQQQNQQQQQRQPKPGAQPAAVDDAEIASFIDPADLATLEQIGGPDLANTLKRSVAKVAGHFGQQNSQLLGAVEFLLEQHVDGQFSQGLKSLEKLPGLEKLGDAADAKQTENRAALRKKADLLHRAAGGNAAGYSYNEAMQDAAASLFKVNLTQAAQAALVTKARDARRGSASRGDGTRKEPSQLSTKDRAAAIFTELQRGASPEEARKAVDGR